MRRMAGIRDVLGFHAHTVSGLKNAFREAADDYLETRAGAGKHPQKPYSASPMLRVDAEGHAKEALTAELSGKSLYPWSDDVLPKPAQKIVPR